MRKVTLHFNSSSHHFSQLISGLEYLHSHKKIDLTYNFDLGRYPVNIFRLEISGINVFFDLADHSKIDQSLYNRSDFYVKRNLLKKDYAKNEKLIPYGLYYPVYYRNTTLKYLFLKKLSCLKYSLKYWKTLSILLNIRDGIGTNELSKVHSLPAEGQQILFRSRLWDAGPHHPDWKREERDGLNNQRIRINKILQKNFGNEFKGGIRSDEYSRSVCPELVLPSKDFHRRNYLKALSRSSIGIATPGLLGSIGAKFGEYIATGTAILTNPIDHFQLLGPLKEGKNHLNYESPEECLEKTELLFSNAGLRREMQEANHEYYKNWLHPGQKMLKIFELIENR